MFTGKMCHNSIMSGHIKFIFGSSHKNDPKERGTKMLPWKCLLPSNGVINSGLYDQFDNIYYYCEHLTLLYVFSTRPTWGDKYYVTWYTHKVPWLQIH